MLVPSTVTARRSRLRAVASWLPHGRTLSDEAWAQRHRWMLWLVCANAVGLFAFALIQGYGAGHALVEGGAVAAFAVVGFAWRGDRRIGSSAVALGLLTASAVSVHLSHGAIEAHFHFFVMIAVLTLYEDWLPFLLAVAYVLLHHGIGGVMIPESVYDHSDATAHPWKWALIHGGFVAAAGTANVLAWRLHEETRGHLRQLATIVESSEAAIISVSTEGVLRSWNGGARRVFGWEDSEVIGGDLAVLVSPDRAGEDRELLRRVLAGDHVDRYESEWRGKDGESIAVRLSASPMREAGGAIVGASAILQDITEQKEAAEALQRERRRLTEAEKIGQMGSWEWDRIADRVEWSEQLCRLFGVSREELGASFGAYLALVHPDDRLRVKAEMERTHASWSFEPSEHRLVRPDGDVRHVLVRGEVIGDEHGDVSRMLGTVVDITERKHNEDAIRDSQEAMAHQALHDALTGLPNRTLLHDRLEHALHRSRRDESRIALLFLDIDRFKMVNDSFGHAAGDELLIQIAGRLDDALRPTDTVARFGGDELAVLCEDVDREHDGIAVAHRVLAAFSRPFVLAGRELFATASIGVAVSQEHDTAERLLRDADVAMYRAKERGGARYEVFDAAMRRRSLERMQTENELRRALGQDELALHYQPVVSLDDRTVIGAEALIRWEHPERGLLSPAAFIPVAEESSLIVAVGEWVLRAACAQLAAWRDVLPPDFTLSVNVSARQFADPGLLVETVRTALQEAGADPARLSLELTEGVLMQQEGAHETLLGLKELGVRVVLDDFGTGYSSLSYLSRFPLDGLKVDRSFVARMQEGSPEHAIVAAVGTMAAAMNLSVVAEGIESDAQRIALRHLGYRHGQGFLFAKPAPPEDFSRLLLPSGAAHLDPRSNGALAALRG